MMRAVTALFVLVTTAYCGDIYRSFAGLEWRGTNIDYYAWWPTPPEPPPPDNHFTATFLASVPETVNLGTYYNGPNDPSNAFYDSGDGTTNMYTGKAIVMTGSYLKFWGDWRDGEAKYSYIFDGTFTAQCRISGVFDQGPSENARAYMYAFSGCSGITEIQNYPFPALGGSPETNMCEGMWANVANVITLPADFFITTGVEGAPAKDMFRGACAGMSSVTNLPDGFMDTSNISGLPATNMFYQVCYGMESVKHLPMQFLNTAGIHGAPALNMYKEACSGMYAVTNLPMNFFNTYYLSGKPAQSMFDGVCEYMRSVTTLPEMFLETGGLTGDPAAYMFRNACSGMSSVTNLPENCLTTVGLSGQPASYMLAGAFEGMSALLFGDLVIGTFINMAATNFVGSLNDTFNGCGVWQGDVLYKGGKITEDFTPSSRTFTFYGCTNKLNYATIPENWK